MLRIFINLNINYKYKQMWTKLLTVFKVTKAPAAVLRPLLDFTGGTKLISSASQKCKFCHHISKFTVFAINTIQYLGKGWGKDSQWITICTNSQKNTVRLLKICTNTYLYSADGAFEFFGVLGHDFLHSMIKEQQFEHSSNFSLCFPWK